MYKKTAQNVNKFVRVVLTHTSKSNRLTNVLIENDNKRFVIDCDLRLKEGRDKMAIEKVTATLKKDVAPVKTATATVKADALKTDIKTPEVKAAAKPAAKPAAKKAAKPAAKKAAAKKPAAKKTTAKKTTTAAAKKPATAAAKKTTAAAAKKPATAAKKTAAKKTTKKTAAKKTVLKTTALFAVAEGENLTADALMKKYLKTAKDRCKYDLGLKTADVKSIDLYLNIKEQMVYSVINGEINDKFEMY